MSIQLADIPKWLAHYTIISELGRGAFSTVYKIKSNINGNTYCLKRISLRKTGDKLNDEVTINKKLNHINLVKFCDSHVEEDYMYIIMEFCEYGDLYSLLRSVQKHKLYINEDILWDIAYQGLLALEYLHSKKIIHRDIKLLNIFMTKDKLVKIGDMGMSKLIDESVKMNLSRVGTPLYLAPELVKKEHYDYKVDIWSFGCSLYHLAKCTPPFNEENLIRLGNAIVSETPPNLPETYSQEFKYFVNLLICKSKDVRPTATMALKLIPEKTKMKYIEKFGHLMEKPPFDQEQGQHKHIDSLSEQSVKGNFNSISSNLSESRRIPKKRASEPAPSGEKNLIGVAGNLIKRQFKFLNSKSKTQNSTQDNFRPNSKEGQGIKTQTCNNFYNFNINVYKVNFNKKGNFSKENNPNNIIEIIEEKTDAPIAMGLTNAGNASIFKPNLTKSSMTGFNANSFPKKAEAYLKEGGINAESTITNTCTVNGSYLNPDKLMSGMSMEGIANTRSLNVFKPNPSKTLLNDAKYTIFPLIHNKNSFTDRKEQKFLFSADKNSNESHIKMHKTSNPMHPIEPFKRTKLLTIKDLK